MKDRSAYMDAPWDVKILIAMFRKKKMIDDEALGFIANSLGIFIFALVIAYHLVIADPNYEGN
ncbi:dolichyl-diphosphooligosaccharide--protein glycosyltransferase subunit 4A isoform X2 [Lathyrus oleraceus]|uniref:dolichyl-diphosphooligosaccharide--protein glycosyltransferase subunit 4A isoform X2 n=1 Tax=Pisum sativum TaxID=3888 RepID=UPI0021CE6441|nr:dolichyl-diphosphooligosaccharide--protein glycosyltransferase subunit 4A-like isoform X2 [Pisum sativum]